MAVELHSDPTVEEKIELELLLRSFATPPRLLVIVKLQPSFF
jgi:hypothetical protein